MTDPYKILGIDRSATDDEIKKAYRELARKYHPDRNPGNSAAEEMFKVVNEAYDQIMDERKNGTAGGYGNAGTGYGGYDPFGGNSYDAEDAHLQAAANYITSGHYDEAMNVLNGITDRTAKWYSLAAMAQQGMGNSYAAVECAKMAVNMEPGNLYYRQLLAQLQGGGVSYTYRQDPYGGYARGNMGNSCMDLCLMNLMCNLCCNPCC